MYLQKKFLVTVREISLFLFFIIYFPLNMSYFFDVPSPLNMGKMRGTGQSVNPYGIYYKENFPIFFFLLLGIKKISLVRGNTRTIAKHREVKNKREKEKKNSGRTDFSFFRIILISFSQ